MTDPRDNADIADLIEQETPLDDEGDEDAEVVVDSTDLEVDDADRWEQATPVRGDRDEYPEG